MAANLDIKVVLYWSCVPTRSPTIGVLLRELRGRVDRSTILLTNSEWPLAMNFVRLGLTCAYTSSVCEAVLVCVKVCRHFYKCVDECMCVWEREREREREFSASLFIGVWVWETVCVLVWTCVWVSKWVRMRARITANVRDVQPVIGNNLNRVTR